MNRKRILIALVCLGVLISAGCAMMNPQKHFVDQIKAESKGPVIEISKNGFSQWGEVTVRSEENVTFVNCDQRPHKICRWQEGYDEDELERSKVYWEKMKKSGIHWAWEDWVDLMKEGYDEYVIQPFSWRRFFSFGLVGRRIEYWDGLFPEKRLKITIIE